MVPGGGGTSHAESSCGVVSNGASACGSQLGTGQLMSKSPLSAGPRGGIPSGYGVKHDVGAAGAANGCPVERSLEAINSWLLVHLFKGRIVQ